MCPEEPGSGSKNELPDDLRSRRWREQGVLLVRADACGQLARSPPRQRLPALPPRCRLSLPGTGLAPCRLVVGMPGWLPAPRVGQGDAPWGECGCRYFDEI